MAGMGLALAQQPDALPDVNSLASGLGAAFAANSSTTQLPPEQEAAFQQWLTTLPPDLQNDRDYDLRGAFLANAQAAANGHLPDTFKKPNHMTFSDGSQYSNSQQQGGQWVDTGKPNPEQPGQNMWVFYPTPFNMTQHGMPEMNRYFGEAEKGNTAIYPVDYNLPKGSK